MPTDIFIYLFLFVGIYFQIFLFAALLQGGGRIRNERKKHAEIISTRDRWPGVTIIVPAYNEERTIERTLQSLLELDYPKEKLHILVINDGSTDGTSLVARRVDPARVQVIDKENGGKYTALNLGITKSTDEFIGCLDADSFVSPGALKHIIPYFDRKEVMAVCPSVQIFAPKNILQRIQATEYMIGALTKKIFTFLNAVYVTPGPFSIYRRSIFANIGGFRHGYSTEDMEMALRMQSKHMIIETAHDAHVFTVAPATLKALYRQRVRWVTGHLKNTTLTYRFMLLRKNYGHLGMFTLPFAVLSVFIALFFSGYALLSFGKHLYQKLLSLWLSGIHFGWPTFEWFFVGSDMKRLLIYYMMMMTILLLLLSTRLTTRQFQMSRGMLYFLFVYGLIAPLWLGKSLWNLLRAKEAPWR